jgi:CheY-like chemotaxis protein
MSEGEVVAGPGRDHAPVLLLVEDEVLIRMSIAEPLRENGFVVLEAGNAAEAIALVSTGHPLDLAITDVRMPGGIDGVTLSDALKDIHPALPVILISGDMSPARKHNADGFLRKPFEVSELLKLITELMDPEWLSNRQHRNAS